MEENSNLTLTEDSFHDIVTQKCPLLSQETFIQIENENRRHILQIITS